MDVTNNLSSGIGGTFSGIGTIEGAGNTSTLLGFADNTTWNINGINSGTIQDTNTSTSYNFSGFGTLTGGDSSNILVLNNGGSLGGPVDGGVGGINTLTVATNTTTNWTITGQNAGTVTGIPNGFTDFSNLNGGTGTNTFTFNNGASIQGNLNGGGSGSNNTLNVSAYTSPVNINVNGGSSSVIGGTLTGVDNLIGTDSGSSALSTLSGLANTTISGANSGTSGVYIFSGFGNLSGGSDTFTFNNAGSISGNLTGDGLTTLDVSALTNPTVNLTTNTSTGIGGQFSGILSFIGGGAKALWLVKPILLI